MFGKDATLTAMSSHMLGKNGAYRLCNKRKRTQTDASMTGGNVTRRNRTQLNAKTRRKLENRWEQSLRGSSPRPSVSIYHKHLHQRATSGNQALHSLAFGAISYGFQAGE